MNHGIKQVAFVINSVIHASCIIEYVDISSINEQLQTEKEIYYDIKFVQTSLSIHRPPGFDEKFVWLKERYTSSKDGI